MSILMFYSLLLIKFLFIYFIGNNEQIMADTVKQRSRFVGQHLQPGTPVSVTGNYFYPDLPVEPRITGVVLKSINVAGKVKVKWDSGGSW